MKYYLAVDIGASSGRHILGHVENGEIICEEIYRFPNGVVEKNNALCWDFDAIFQEILIGMKKCAALGKIPESVGIDTWGVDFVLLDGENKVLGNTVSYRDGRTTGMDEAVYNRISAQDLYQRTGTPKYLYNTIFQLMALQKSGWPAAARTLLMTPDYLHYKLSGIAKTEYTIASTSGLLHAKNRVWDDEIITACGFPRGIFQEIVPPGTPLGSLTPEIQAAVGYNTRVVVPATHDTASAVATIPAENTLFISSGTWSIMGTQRSTPICTPESMARHFANEGGYQARYRYLKNIMGLWMIQCVKSELPQPLTYEALCALAAEETIPATVDCNDTRFFAPKNMTQEIQAACEESNQPIPTTPAQLAKVVYQSLAQCYHKTATEIEEMTGETFPAIHIVGGGANNAYLNQLTAQYTQKNIVIGATEATAIGNLMAQINGGR